MRQAKDIAFKIDSETGCWNCTSHHGTRTNRYPTINKNGKTMSVHRHVYMQHAGRNLPSDVEVMHTCDNPKCINPAHLSEGSHEENMRQAAERDRMVFGEQHHMAKLTMTKAREIVRSSERHIDLAAKYGVTPSTIWHVRTGKTWQRATGLSQRR